MGDVHDMLPEEHRARIMADIEKGGAGGGGDMEQRIAKLEVKVDHIAAAVGTLTGRVDKMDDRLRGVEVNLATLTERVAHLPSKGFIVNALLAALAVVAALTLFQTKLQAIFGLIQ